jgi:hypothetical protein
MPSIANPANGTWPVLLVKKGCRGDSYLPCYIIHSNIRSWVDHEYREAPGYHPKRQASCSKGSKTKERQAKEEQLKHLKNAKHQEMNHKLSQVKLVLGAVKEEAVERGSAADENDRRRLRSRKIRESHASVGLWSQFPSERC